VALAVNDGSGAQLVASFGRPGTLQPVQLPYRVFCREPVCYGIACIGRLLLALYKILMRAHSNGIQPIFVVGHLSTPGRMNA
jgi:hypothetical protein